MMDTIALALTCILTLTPHPVAARVGVSSHRQQLAAQYPFRVRSAASQGLRDQVTRVCWRGGGL